MQKDRPLTEKETSSGHSTKQVQDVYKKNLA